MVRVCTVPCKSGARVRMLERAAPYCPNNRSLLSNLIVRVVECLTQRLMK